VTLRPMELRTFFVTWTRTTMKEAKTIRGLN